MKPLGKQSVRSAVEDIYPWLPVRFSAIHLQKLVARKIGRPEVFPDTILRKCRELKQEGKINFKNIDKAHSIYLKIQ
jgi:hypothetical protein